MTRPTKKSTLFFLIVYCLIHSFTATAQKQQSIFTSDIDHFWNAFDSVQATKEKDQQIALMQSLYIDKGTTGLQLFMQLRNFDAAKLVESINKYPKFWISIRNNTLTIPPKVPAIENSIIKFKELYPELRPAKIFFTITPARAAGVTQDSMILIGSEITMGNKFTDVSEFPDKRLANFFKSKTTDNIVPVAVHEYVHAQQKTESKILLGQCIYEGACDFITELVLHEPLTHSYLVYGKQHEKQLMEQFSKEMYTEDLSNWLYNGTTTKTMGDLGYFMGYAICKSYYRHAKDKQAAIKHIIRLDYSDLPTIKQFLHESKYYEE